MSENIFNKIIINKRNKIELLKKTISINELNERIKKRSKYMDFKSKIKENLNLNKTSIIAEIKKASPSAGMIIEKYNPVDIAKIYYKNNATCLSVSAWPHPFGKW